MFKFNSFATAYDPVNALSLAKASSLAYLGEDMIRRTVLEDWKFASFEPISVDRVQLFIAANDEIVMVVFTGTNEASDWGINLDSKKIPSEFGGIHKGFKEALDRVRGSITQVIEKLRTKNQSIWITGHSLGGALVTLFAIELTKMEQSIGGIYTYGQPPVGDEEFVEKFNAQFKTKTFRFVNNNDGVPEVSLIKRLGYKHAGQFLYFGVSGRLYFQPPVWFLWVHGIVGFILNGSEWILNKAIDIKTFESYDDHNMKWYIANLKNLQSQ